MKRFALSIITLATLLVLILPAVSLAATDPVNPSAGPDDAQRVYLPVIGKE
jgi:hypothetical protein